MKCHYFTENFITLAAANFENILGEPWFPSSRDQNIHLGRSNTSTSKDKNQIYTKHYKELVRKSKTQLSFLTDTLVPHDHMFIVHINSNFLKFYGQMRPIFFSLLYRKSERIRYHSHSYICKYFNSCSKRSGQEYVMICDISSRESLELVTTFSGSYISSVSCHDLCLGGSFEHFKASLLEQLGKMVRNEAVLYLRNLDILESSFQGIQLDEIGEIFHKSLATFFRPYDSTLNNEPSLVVLTDSQSHGGSKVLNSGSRVVDLLSFKYNIMMSCLSTKKKIYEESEYRCIGSNKVQKNELISTKIARRFQNMNKNFMTWNPTEVNGMYTFPELHYNSKALIEKKVQKKYRKSQISKFTTKNWTDVGGLDSIKIKLKNMLNFSVKYQKLIPCTGLRKKGILLYGPPGTGKTLIARVIASEVSSHFINVKGPEIMDMYVGESEKHIREIFEEAKKYRPSVIFFDELDALAQSRPYYSENISSSTRVVSQLLTEVDDLTKYDDIFTIGATNRPDLIEPALLRPGRFETPIFIGVDSSKGGRQKLLKALTKGFIFSDMFTFEVLSERISYLYTGADMYAVCVDAWLEAAKRTCFNGAGEGVAAGKIRVKESDFRTALEENSPSLRDEDLTRYSEIEKSFK